MAGALPRYGTCWILVPAMALNSSPARCVPPPVPDELNDSLPG